jgi:uncharacterized protein (TIGR03083 family)
MMEPVGEIETAPLFRPLHGELMGLLRGLAPAGWEKPTRAGAWRVRDVAAHLLDTALRRLSFHRDGMNPPPPDTPFADADGLLRFLDALNADWVRAARRLSPQVLVELLETAGGQCADFLAGLPPHGEARFPVAWAGEDVSQNWMDVAREYTEQWHHQQQIREAVGAPLLLERTWLFPMLDASVRALPHAYRDVAAEPGQAVAFRFTGEAGGDWCLQRDASSWRLLLGSPEVPACRVTTDADTAWRVLFKAIDPDAAQAAVAIEGETRLGTPFLAALAVMARR